VTSIDFYTHVADRLRTACRLAGKAHASGLSVHVLCPDADAAQTVDRLLWTASATGFVPHCTPEHRLAPVTPVHVDHTGAEPVHDGVLINLCGSEPPFFGRFERLIEIVSLDEEDRRRARERYRYYRDRGYPLRSHDLSQSAP
jgi:DNA polymerase-3 subunit chi